MKYLRVNKMQKSQGHLLKKAKELFMGKLYLLDFAVIVFFILAILVSGWKSLHQGAKLDIGYADIMDHVGSMMRLTFGEIPFRDFYYPYGPLILLIFYVPFLILGRNFFSFSFSFYILLPIMVCLILYLVFRKLFKSRLMSIASLCFVYVEQMLIGSPSSLRMIFPLLVVPLFLSAKTKPKISWFLIGFITIVSFFISYEYGLATFIAVSIIFGLLIIFRHKNKELYYLIFPLLLGLSLSAFIAIIVLMKLQILKSFIDYASSSSFFYTNFPPQSIYLPPAILLRLFQSPIGILRSLASQNFHFYFVGLFYIISGIYIILKILKSKFKVDNFDIIVLFLTVYGGISYIRPLTTPAYGYLFTSVAPLLLLSGFYLKKIGNSGIIIFSFLVLSFSIFFPQDGYYSLKNLPKLLDSKFWSNPTNGWVVFDKAIGMTVDKKLSQEYRKVTEFITSHTSSNERVFVYPYGPYNLLANRRNPAFSDEEVYRLFYPEGPDAYDKRMIREIEEKNTRFIVLNTYNGGNVLKNKAFVGIANYLTWSSENRIFMIFPSNLDPVFIKYIIGNYEPIEYFDYAVVLQKRKSKVEVNYNFIQTQLIDNDQNNIETYGLKKSAEKFIFQITSHYPFIKICWDRPVVADTVKIKISSKYTPLLNFFSKPRIDLLLTESCDDLSYFFPAGSFSLSRNSPLTHHQAIIPKNEKIKGMILGLSSSEPFNILPSEITIEELKIGISKTEEK